MQRHTLLVVDVADERAVVVRLTMVIRRGSPVARASQKSYVALPVVAPENDVVVRMRTAGTGVSPTSTVSSLATRPGPCSLASPVEQDTVKVVPGRSPTGRNGVPVQMYVVFSVTPKNLWR